MEMSNSRIRNCSGCKFIYNWREMKRYLRHDLIVISIFWFILFQITMGFSQDLGRSRGIGLRGGFWNAKNKSSKYSSDRSSPFVSLDWDASGSITFFTRLKGNLFLETNISGLGQFTVDADLNDGNSGESTIGAIIPLLLGCRYDLLPAKYASPFQPYVGSGLGPYISIEHLTRQSYVSERTDVKFGFYGCLGLNVVIRSWIAVNCDIRYHFINFQTEDDYSGLQFCTGLNFMWGKPHELFHIEDTKVIVRDIYPAYYQFYNTYPLALVTVKNIVSYPIEVNVKSDIRGYSERIQESGFIQIAAGELRDIPVRALFGSKLLQTSQQKSTSIVLEVEARAGATQTKSFSEQITIHNRNAWDGKVDKLGFFITTDDESILHISREIGRTIPDLQKNGTRNFQLAKVLFNELKRRGIGYRSDPNIPFYKDDRVQFAKETLESGSGDCDDLVVLYSSLLESVGINTAFIDVNDPEKDIAHVYLMFDSGLPPEQSGLMSSNEKRFVLWENGSDKRSVWIPVETTLLEEGFEAAWKTGALQYLQEGILRNGVSEGWVKIINVE